MASSSSQTDGSTAEKSKRNREIPIHDISESDRASKHLKTEDNANGSSAELRYQTEYNENVILYRKNREICLERISKSLKATGHIKLPDLLVEQSWLEALPADEFQKPYANILCMFVERQYFIAKHLVYPPPHLIFNALNTTPFHSVKVVILGKEPYLEPGQAMGLSFSVHQEARIPSILKNVFKELEQDLGCWVPSHGNLVKWALQGVLLLNILLTGCLSEVDTNSHASIGWVWEQFTDSVIRTISEKKEGVVFLLWGKSAQEKIRIIDETKHHILKAAHPSEEGFFGCKHFSKTNQLLEEKGFYPIEFNIEL